MTGPVLSLSSSTMPGDPVLSIQDTVEGSPRFKNSLAATEVRLDWINSMIDYTFWHTLELALKV